MTFNSLDPRQPRFAFGPAGEFDYQLGSLHPNAGLGINGGVKLLASLNSRIIGTAQVEIGYRHFSAAEREPNLLNLYPGTPSQHSLNVQYQFGVLFCPEGYQKALCVDLQYKGVSNLKPDPWQMNAVSLGFDFLKTLEKGDLISVRLFLDIANANIGEGKRVELAQGGTIAETAIFGGLAFGYLWTDVPALKPKKK